MSEKIEKSEEKSKDFKKFILPVSLSIVCLVVGFGGGVLFQKAHSKLSFNSRNGQVQMSGMMNNNRGNGSRNGNQTGNRTGAQNGSGSGAVFGEITKIDDSSITVKTADGSSKIILISNTTTFNKSASAAKTDLTVGAQVRIDGTTDSNTGSVTSKTIEINPAMPNQTKAPQQ